MSQRDIFRFWLPLFGSWLLLTSEGPIITTVINRLPDPVTMLAAAGIVLALSVFIESPIINLLATSTAKVDDYASYRQVRRFAIHWAILLTVVHLLVGFTPLFDWLVVRAMGVEQEIAQWVRVGMQIMVPWSAAIAWRRFLQGVLIKFDRTRTVAVGTAIRLVSGVITLFVFGYLLRWPGIVVGAATWITGVVAEAIYATVVVRPLFANELMQEKNSADSLTYPDLFWFHLPLAATAVLTLLVQPMATFALTRLADPRLSLAAWPLLFQILLIARAPALAMPEVIIALNKNSERTAALWKFIGTLFVVTLVGMGAFVLSSADRFYLQTIQQAVPSVTELAESGVLISVLFPAITLLVFALRGFLISNQTTRPVNTGMIVNLIVTAIILAVGFTLNWAGIFTAALALNVAVVFELLYLVWERRKTREAQLHNKVGLLTK